MTNNIEQTQPMDALFRSIIENNDPHLIIQILEISDYAAGELDRSVVARFEPLLKIHQADMQKDVVATDYFSILEPSEEVLSHYEEITEKDRTWFAHQWITRNTLKIMTDNYHPKAVGSMLRTLFSGQKEALEKGIELSYLMPDTEELPEKIARLLELKNIADPKTGGDAWENVEHLQYGPSDVFRMYGIMREANGLAALSLLRYGFRSELAENVFRVNHAQLLLQKTDNSHIQALNAFFALSTNEFVDKDKMYYLSLGLVSAAYNSDQPIPDDVVETVLSGEDAIVRLFTLTAGKPKDALTNETLARLLNDKQSSDMIFFATKVVAEHSIPLHSESYLAERIRETKFSADDVVVIAKQAIGAVDGHFEDVDPIIKELINQPFADEKVDLESLAELSVICMGFETVIPDFLQQELYKIDVTTRAAAAFAANDAFFVTSDVFVKNFFLQPHDLTFTEGISFLPQVIKEALESDETDYDIVVRHLIPPLIDFFREYFDTPRSAVAPNEHDDFYSRLWNEAHTDIWAIVRKASPDAIIASLQKKIPGGEVAVYRRYPNSKIREIRKTSIKDCLPPDIFEVIQQHYLSTAKDEDRIAWATAGSLPIGTIDSIHADSESGRSMLDFSSDIWRHIPHEQFTKEYAQQSVEDLLTVAISYGIDIEVFDPVGRNWIIFPNDAGDKGLPVDTRLVIKDPVRLLRRFMQLKEVASRKQKDEPWYRHINLATVWRNATPNDFLDPIRFLERQLYQATVETLHDIKDLSLADVLTLDETITASYQAAGTFPESQHDIAFSLAKDTPSPIDALPSVRFGVVADDTAVVYAIQMPSIEGMAPSSARYAIQNMEQAEELQHAVSLIIKNSPEEFVAICGMLSEDLLGISDSEEFLRHLRKQISENMAVETFDQFHRELLLYLDKLDAIKKGKGNLVVNDSSSPVNVLFNAVRLIDDYDRATRLEGVFAERSARMKRVNAIFEKEKKGKGEIRNIPSGPTLSLALFCMLAKSQGINHIEIPTYFPRRLHSDPEVDTRIVDQTIKTVEALCNIVSGIEVVSLPDMDHSFHLRLTDEMKSDNPTLAEAIKRVGLHESKVN